MASGPGPGPNWSVGKPEVLVVNTPQTSIWVGFNGNLPIHLKWMSCQLVTQRVYLNIHIMLWFLQLDNSTLSQLGIEQPICCFCMFCSLRNRLFCIACSPLYMVYFCLERWSVVLLWVHVSEECLDYPICMTKYCWYSVDADCHDGVTHMSCTGWDEKAVRKSYMNYCHQATIIFDTMGDQHSVMIHWLSFSWWGFEHVAIVFAPKGGQYLISECLQPIPS